MVLSTFGCPPYFLTIIREFHDGMKTWVIIGGQESDPFKVLAGVKQGCVLAPAIFNLFWSQSRRSSGMGCPLIEAYHSNIVSIEVFVISGGSNHRLKSQLTLCMSFSMQMMPLCQVTRPLASRRI